MRRTVWLLVLLAASPASAQVTEKFDKAATLTDGVAFGQCKQLTANMAGGGSITVAGNNLAALSTPGDADAATISSTNALPSGTWKVVVEVSQLNFPKNPTTGPRENGTTLLAIVSGKPTQGIETSWAGKRIIGVEIDNINDAGAAENTIYVNYWASGTTMYSWNGTTWSTSWVPAFNYDGATTYSIEIEKGATSYQVSINGGTPVIASIEISSVSPTSPEYLVIGDRLTDAFHGSMDVRSVTLPQASCAGTPTGDGGSIEPKKNDWGPWTYDGSTKKNNARPTDSACDCRLSSPADGLAAAPVLLAILFMAGVAWRSRRRR